MSEKWTADQLSAIETTDKAVIVSAAAGSGKTAVLIERTIRLLCDEKNQIPADKLLAVTFTNDAASQMREKLSNALNKKIEQEPTNEWLQLQQMKLQLAKISTINAFCLDLVKNNIQNFDISNGVRILDETEYSVMLTSCVEDVMEKYYSEKPEMMVMLNDEFCVGDDKKLAEMILQLFSFSRSLPFKDSWFKNVIESYDINSDMYKHWEKSFLDDVSARFGMAMNSIAETMKIADSLECYSAVKNIIKSDYDTAREIRDSLKSGDWDNIAEAFAGFSLDRFNGRADKGTSPGAVETAQIEYIKNSRNSYKNEIVSLKEIFTYSKKQIIADLAQNKLALESLVMIVNDLWDKLWEHKVAKNAIDFADVELLSIQLLAEECDGGYRKTKLAQDIVSGDEYRIILIDEFQDVNNLQDIIFKMLSQSEKDEIIGRNMFVVGDVKQSIYRFRQANPNIFIQTRKASKEPENTDIISEIKLRKNFRSRKCVIDFVNFVFEKIMSSEIGEVDYDKDEALDLGASYDDRLLDTEILVVDSTVEDESDDFVPPNEPMIVAKRIRQMLDEGYPVFENGTTRPCRQGDFCVLLRSKTVNKEYIKAFKEMGLQAQCEELTGYLRSREISVLINMLTVIDNPMNDIALTSVLLSPVFMFTADDIAELRVAKPDSKIYPVLLSVIAENDDKINKKIYIENETLVEKCRYVVGKIRELRFFASSLTLEKLIIKIYDSTDFFSLASTYKDGTQKRANLRLLLEYANSYDKSISGGLTGFIRYIASIFKNGGDLKQAGVINSTSDSVEIKTIHKSKGLEYPFVFLCRSSTKFTQQKRDLSKEMLINLYSGVGFRFKSPKSLLKYTTLPYDAIRTVNEKEMLSEEMRLLYVALTRAKEKLFITYNINNSIIKGIGNTALNISKAGGVVPSLVKSANSMQDWLTMALLTYKGDSFLRNICDATNDGLDIPLTDTEAQISFISDLGELSAEIPEEEKVAEKNILPSLEIISEIKHYIGFEYDSSLSQTTSKMSVSEIAKKDSTLEFFYQIPRLDDDKGTLSAAEKGTATHAFMQFADFEKAEKSVDDEISRLVSIGLLSKKQGKAINKPAVSAFFDGEFFARMKNSTNIMREKQFLVMISELRLDDDEFKEYNNTDSMLQGIADCLFEEPDGYVLVDYKTDNVKTVDELTQHYTLQLKMYKAAFDLILDKPVKSSYIYSFKLQTGIEIAL